MSNFIINTVRIKNRNADYLLWLDTDENQGESNDSVVRLRCWNNEYVLDETYGFPDRDSARNFIDHHSPEFIKAELIRVAIGVGADAMF